MSKPAPIAGGFFLIVPIIAGFVWGLVDGRAMQGVLIGTAIGLILLGSTWLVDRARQRR